jgi:phosphatidate cytidylyltransferase
VTEQGKPRSDLGIRTLSGVVMMSIAIAAIWFGGYAFMALVVLVGLGVFWEFAKLVLGFTQGKTARFLWLLGGTIYVGLACFSLLLFGLLFDSPLFEKFAVVTLIAGVIGTDVGAYFAGRTIGGPKIAPKVSPSKTWSGLVGGMIGAGLAMLLVQNLMGLNYLFVYDPPFTMAAGGVLACIAQAGDFFESWMKRRAGVKDSGNLIPGHGGLFDRADGLIAVSFVVGLIFVASMLLDRATT